MRTEEEITDMVASQCKERLDNKDLSGAPGVIGYSFEIVDFVVNVQRITDNSWTLHLRRNRFFSGLVSY